MNVNALHGKGFYDGFDKSFSNFISPIVPGTVCHHNQRKIPPLFFQRLGKVVLCNCNAILRAEAVDLHMPPHCSHVSATASICTAYLGLSNIADEEGHFRTTTTLLPTDAMNKSRSWS